MNQSKKHEGKNQRLDVAAKLRAQQAIRLRAQRLRWEEVAEGAGFASAGAAHNAVRRELARSLSTDIEAWRQEELAMLDELQRRVWSLALPTDPKKDVSLFAVDRLLQISKARREITAMDMPPRATPAPVAQVLIHEVNFNPDVI